MNQTIYLHVSFASHGRFPSDLHQIPYPRRVFLRYMEEECVPNIVIHELWFYLCVEYDNSSVGEEEHFERRHLISAITDWQVSRDFVFPMPLIVS